MTDVLQVFTTLPTREQAQAVARQLIEERHAACVQVLGPLESTYRWQGKVEQAEEWLLLVKTTQAAYRALEGALRRLHPYEVPEILATAATAGYPAYLDWVSAQVNSTHQP
jgi:periplasmic divalent cation tolerance protein